MVLGATMIFSASQTNEVYTYVITETSAPSSLDPLDADQTPNLPVARMLYATPIEVDFKGDLTSQVLEHFEYNEATYEIIWKVKEGLKFSDNTELTPTDVAFAIARMAHKRPTFPVIENIRGLNDWLHSKDSLSSFPSGIRIDGQIIKIQFDKKQDHPLFRFCLELFSIIPKRCVDPKTNAIVCKEIPNSGYYKLVSRTENEIQFTKRLPGPIHGCKAPEKLLFKYISSQEVFKAIEKFDPQTIMSGNELRYSIEQIKDLKSKLQISFAPASRIVGLVLNPKVGAFRDKKCRQIFAKAFRDTYGQIVGDVRQSESSIFTDILPGYLKSEELYANISSELNTAEVEHCRVRFNKEPIKWLKAKNNQKSIFVTVMEKVFSELGIEYVSPINVDAQDGEEELFLAGNLSVVGFQTGFWAFDPAGDIQMLMTPHMHKTLEFVSQDAEMQNLIKNLKASGLEKLAFTKLNRHIYEESLFNIFTHVRRFYAAKDSSLIMEAPVSITSPAPWQVFNVEQR